MFISIYFPEISYSIKFTLLGQVLWLNIINGNKFEVIWNFYLCQKIKYSLTQYKISGFEFVTQGSLKWQ